MSPTAELDGWADPAATLDHRRNEPAFLTRASAHLSLTGCRFPKSIVLNSCPVPAVATLPTPNSGREDKVGIHYPNST
jgi:hypothetical protein